MSFQHVSDDTLSGYLSGELTAREKYDADTHFTICPECAARLEEQRSFEKKIAAAYNSSFPLYLSPDAHKAVADEVSAGFAVDTQASLWQKRIVFKLVAQAASVVLVAASIALMVFTQSREPAVTPVQTTGVTVDRVVNVPVKAKMQMQEQASPVKIAEKSPVAKTVAPLNKKQKDTAQPVQIVKNAVPIAPVAAAASVASSGPAVSKKIPADPLLKQHDSLVKIFKSDKIAIRKMSDRNFVLQGVKSPFTEDLYVIYAASGVPENDTKRTVELSLSTVRKLEYVSFHPAGQKDVCVMAFRARSLPREFGNLETVITENQEKRTNTLHLGRMLVNMDFATAPESVRLAAILHAVSNPRLVLKRTSRSKIIAELEKLLAGGYAADPQIKALYEQLKKVR